MKEILNKKKPFQDSCKSIHIAHAKAKKINNRKLIHFSF